MNTVIIELEDLVANAIIELNEATGVNFISMDLVIDYAEAVTKYLLQKKIVPSLLIDCETYEIFRTDCDEYYEMDEIANNETTITLRKEKTTDDLKFVFRSHIRPEVLEAYMSSETLSVLGIGKREKVNSTLVLR